MTGKALREHTRHFERIYADKCCRRQYFQMRGDPFGTVKSLEAEIESLGKYLVNLRREVRREREERQERARVAREQRLTVPPIRTRPPRWHQWKQSEIPDVEPVIAVTETDDVASPNSHALVDEIQHRGDGVLSWAPWVRRERYSNRSRWYEGFYDPYRRVGR